jgi:hypothetical protein
MEEVFGLEKQLRVTEKTVNAAVQKISALMDVNKELGCQVEEMQAGSLKMEQEAAAMVEALHEQFNSEKQLLQKELDQFKQLGNIEDLQAGLNCFECTGMSVPIVTLVLSCELCPFNWSMYFQAENTVLQERVMAQQMQISALHVILIC